MNPRSFLYRELTQEQLHQVCSRCLGEELQAAQLLRGGMFNTTYRLETATQQAVLRVGPVNRHLLLPFENRLMQAEAEIMGLLADHGIPTSRLIAWETPCPLLERDVMLVECLPAAALSTGKWPEETVLRLHEQVGGLARRMHSITPAALPQPPLKPFGRYASVLDGHGCATWREAVLLEVQQWQRKAQAIELLPAEVLARIDSCFARHGQLLDAITAPRLVHCDLWAGNVLVTEEGQLAAIIDCDRAMFGDPDFDLATGWMITEAFLRGYGAMPDDADRQTRRRLYKLLLEMEDCYIHLAEYNNPAESEHKRESILRLLNQLK